MVGKQSAISPIHIQLRGPDGALMDQEIHDYLVEKYKRRGIGRHRRSLEDYRDIYHMRKNGMTFQEIGRAIGRTPQMASILFERTEIMDEVGLFR